MYTLDIITQKGNAKAAYEGILVINQQPTTIINETTKQIINQEINQNSRVDIDTKIIFKDNTQKSKPSVKCLPHQNLVDGKCESVVCKDDSIVVNGKCVPLGGPLPPTTPICDENTPAGVTCIDEGDPDDCRKGFVDKGFGCEREGQEKGGTYICDGSDVCSHNDGDGTKGATPMGQYEDTGGSNPYGEEEDQNCGGEPCTDDEKEDSWLDDEEDYTVVDEKPDDEENKDEEAVSDKIDEESGSNTEVEEVEEEEEEEVEEEEEEEKQVNDSN